MPTKYDPIPKRPGFVVTAAAWRKDKGRFRLQQVCYEAKRQRDPIEDQPPAQRRQGLLL